jgi:hypothetical protein
MSITVVAPIPIRKTRTRESAVAVICQALRGRREWRSGADEPAGSVKVDFISVHVGIKGGANRFDDFSANLLVHLV